jgi:Spy/CpxP family protein refolding chaperone
MNRSICAVVALAVVLGLMKLQHASTQEAPPPATAPKQEGGAAGKQGGRRDGKKHEAETPLSQQMEKIDDAMTFLKRGLRDPAKREECLAQVASAQAACVAAKLLVPKMAVTTAEAERAAFVTNYRKGMAALLIEFTNLELSLLNGDQEASLASYKKLEKMKDEGHDAFTEGG